MKSSTKIAAALSRVRSITRDQKSNILRSNQLTRADRELLLHTKWLQEIFKGWYLLVKPDVSSGDSSTWYANLWDFLRVYLAYHFENAYCLSAENSLDLHTGSTVIPKQVIVISSKGGGSPLNLPFDTSLFVYADSKSLPEEKTTIQGLQVMTLPFALCKVSPSYFQKNPKDAQIAMQLVRDSTELSALLFKNNWKSAAQRLIGAYDFIGNKEMAENLTEELTAFGWKIEKENPFVHSPSPLPAGKALSPYVARIVSMWNEYREKIIPLFPSPPGLPKKPENYLNALEELYEQDAYNSLSIEGYQVDEDLIARVHNAEWNPDNDPRALQERNTLAARGYYEAFIEVKKSLQRIFQHKNPGEVVEKDLRRWYQHLFAPLVRSGILQGEDLLGYRKAAVYIRNSRHIPLPKEALIDAMEALFECLRKEENAAVRAILGHYIFVYIHPYMDGNGRLGRFLMNTMFASGGYPWTIVQVKNRTQYLDSLEIAGYERNIEPFARFIALEMQNGQGG